MRATRYGTTTRKKVDAVKELTSAKYKCPRCKHYSMKRVSSGIWECRKCGLRIASDAYKMSVEKI